MLQFLRGALGTKIVGAALTLVSFGFAIVGVALAVEGPTPPVEVGGMVVPALLFFLAGQWLLWVRHLVSGADSVARGLAVMAIGTVLLGLSVDQGTKGVAGRLLFSAAGLLVTYLGGKTFRDGARMRRAGDLVAAASRELGLHASPLRYFRTPTAHGAIEGIPVKLEGENADVSLEVGAALESGLVLASEVGAGRIRGVFHPNQVQTGDRQFDEQVFVQGEPARTLAVLDSETRSMVAAIARTGAVVSNGKVRLSGALSRLDDGSSGEARPAGLVSDMVRRLAAVAKRLAADEPIPALLLRNATTDRDGEARVRNLEALLTYFAGSPETARACALSLRDSDRTVQITAACHLLSGESGCPETLREAAIAALDGSADPRVEAILLDRVRHAKGPVVFAALRALGSSGGKKSVEELTHITKDLLAGKELKAAAAEALERIELRLRQEGGHLSMPAADAEAGTLSLSGPAGALTLENAARVPGTKTSS